MKKVLFESVSEAELKTFEEVSIESPGSSERLLQLIGDRKRIKYDVNTMPTLSEPVRLALEQQGYAYAAIKSDADKRLLIPLKSLAVSEYEN